MKTSNNIVLSPSSDTAQNGNCVDMKCAGTDPLKGTDPTLISN